MTKIVAMVGSPKGIEGYSGQLIKNALAGIEEAGGETEIFPLYKYNILPCRGCYTCSKQGKCIHDDDFHILQQAMLDADGFILATPNYMNSVTSQMKSFIDRSFSYLYHCQTIKGKHALLIVSSGGPQLDRVEDYLGNVLEMYGCWKVGVVSAPEPILDDKEECLRPLEQATEYGQRLVSAIVRKKTYPAQVEMHDYYFSVMEFLIPFKKDLFSWEYEYWKTHWGLSEETETE